METMKPAAYWFQLVCKHLLCVHGHVIVMGSIILSSWVESGRQWGWNNVAILPVKGRGCLRRVWADSRGGRGRERYSDGTVRVLDSARTEATLSLNFSIYEPIHSPPNPLFFLFCFVQFFEPVWVGFCHSEPKASCLNLVTKPKWEYDLVNTIKLFNITPRIDFRA